MAGKYHNTRPVTPDMFWSRVRRGEPAECWHYAGSVGKNGYYEVRFERKREYAHRIAYMLTFPEWDRSDFVLHRCDNRLCCNPSHLFHGSQQDNVADMLEKGRGKLPPRGTWNAKLTPAQVLEIRASKSSSYTTADQYGVAPSLVRGIRKRVVWRHI